MIGVYVILNLSYVYFLNLWTKEPKASESTILGDVKEPLIGRRVHLNSDISNVRHNNGSHDKNDIRVHTSDANNNSLRFKNVKI